MCKIMISPVVREQKSIQHCQFQSVTLHISGTVDHIKEHKVYTSLKLRHTLVVFSVFECFGFPGH